MQTIQTIQSIQYNNWAIIKMLESYGKRKENNTIQYNQYNTIQ